MPFKSKRQAAYMFARHPKVATRWAAHTSKRQWKRMPERKRKRG